MTPDETHAILRWVETALEVYRKNEGKLSAREIRMKSLLAVARAELLAELRTEGIESSRDDTDLFGRLA